MTINIPEFYPITILFYHEVQGSERLFNISRVIELLCNKAEIPTWDSVHLTIKASVPNQHLMAADISSSQSCWGKTKARYWVIQFCFCIHVHVCNAMSIQMCPTLCKPLRDFVACQSPLPRLQTRILEAAAQVPSKGLAL